MSTFWRYVRIQLFVLLCGIVGPIFLIGYFVSQPDPAVRWMYWWGLFITAADILLALQMTEWVVQKDHEVAEKAALKRLTRRN